MLDERYGSLDLEIVNSSPQMYGKAVCPEFIRSTAFPKFHKHKELALTFRRKLQDVYCTSVHRRNVNHHLVNLRVYCDRAAALRMSIALYHCWPPGVSTRLSFIKELTSVISGCVI